MVSNESLEHNLSNKYKIYLFYACQNVAEAKKLPLPLQKLSKNAIFWSKFSINYYFKQQCDCFYIKHV